MSPQFEDWWRNIGSAHRPQPTDDLEEFAKFVAWQAWHRGTYYERKRCVETVKEWIEEHNRGSEKG